MIETGSFLFIFKYFIFYAFFLFLGRGFTLLICKHKDIDFIRVFGFNSYIFFPTLGLFIFGNWLVVLNFVRPTSSNWAYLILLLFFLNIKNLPNYKSLKKMFQNQYLYLLFLFASYNLEYHYDAGLYHLNFQGILRESNIVLGISNIYGPYGISSIYDYISSALWFDNTLVLLQFVNLIFMVLFFEIVFYLLFDKNLKQHQGLGVVLLIFSLLDNFGYGGGRNGFLYFQGLGKQDVSLGILYAATVFFIALVIKKSSATNIEFLIISIFTVFIIQMKVSGVTIILVYLFMILYLYKLEKINSHNLNILFFIGFLGIVWSLKSILQTGCVVYPLEVTCLKNLAWFSEALTTVTRESAQTYSIAFDFSSTISDWFLLFIDYNINKMILINFVSSYVIIRFIFYRKIVKSKMANTGFINLLVLSNLLFYLYFGPHMRYLIATQLILIGTIPFFREYRFTLNKKILYILFVSSILLTVRLDSYKSFDLMTHPNHPIPIPEVVEFDNRFLPEKGDQCWSIINCSPNRNKYKVVENEFFTVVTDRD